MATTTDPATTSSTPLCSACENPGTRRCSGCKNSHYCSENCQQKDWPLHKLLCESFANFQDRPSEIHRRGIYFPEHESRPRFVWLKFDSGLGVGPDTENYIGEGKRMGMKTLDCYPPLHRMLGYDIAVFHNDNFLLDGSLPNKSLQKLVGPEHSSTWRGGLVAQGMDDFMDHEKEECTARDLDTTALAPIIDFLKFF